jgi:hypothetical protein
MFKSGGKGGGRIPLDGAKLLFPVKLRLSKLGGGGKYPLLFNGFVKLFTVFVVC